MDSSFNKDDFLNKSFDDGLKGDALNFDYFSGNLKNPGDENFIVPHPFECDDKKLEDEIYKTFGNDENVGAYNNKNIFCDDEKDNDNMEILSKNSDVLKKTTKADTTKNVLKEKELEIKVNDATKTNVKNSITDMFEKSEGKVGSKKITQSKFGSSFKDKDGLKNKTYVDIKKYIGDAKGYTKNDTNDLPYSILCQIQQNDFDKIVEYVDKYDALFVDIVKKLKIVDSDDFFVRDIYNYVIPKTFLQAFDRSRIAVGKEYSKHANYIRAGILLKQIETKLNYKENNCSSLDLSETIKNKTVIEFSQDEANDFLSTLGKNVEVRKFNKMGCYKTYGAITVSTFSIEAIAKLLSKPVFVYVSKSFEKPEALGFIFKNPVLHNASDLLPIDGEFHCKKNADSKDNDLKKINLFIEEAVDFWEKENNIKNNAVLNDTVFFCFVSNRDSDYTVPLGLDKNGENYVYSSIEKHISKNINKDKQDDILVNQFDCSEEKKFINKKRGSDRLSNNNRINKFGRKLNQHEKNKLSGYTNGKRKSSKSDASDSNSVNSLLKAFDKLDESKRKKFLSMISNRHVAKTYKNNKSVIDIAEK